MNTDLSIYNALDGACTREIWEQLWPDLERNGYQRTYELSVHHLEVLCFMMARGIKIDRDNLEKSRLRVRSLEGEKREELNRLCGREINPLSSKQLQQYFYIDMKVKPYVNKDTGNLSVDDLALQRLGRPTSTRRAFPEARLIQEIRGLNKLAGTYLEIEFDSDDRLRCAYKPRGTRFGRMSSSKTIYGTGMNVQNLPPEFKMFCVPDDGYFFVEVDKRQAEWVVVAYLSGDASMLTAIQEGKDVHVHTASLMFKVPDDIVRVDSKLIGSSTDSVMIQERRMSDPILSPYIDQLISSMSARQAGKKANHGLNYDEQYRTFSLMNQLEESEGRRIVELYHSIYPNIRNVWYKNVQQKLLKDRTLENCFGRKYHFMQPWDYKLLKEAYSMQPQSTVVDSLNIGMKACYDDPRICGVEGANGDILAQVHDSLLFQFPLSALDGRDEDITFFRIIQDIFHYVSPEMEYNGRRFKIATDMKVGMNWGSFHKDENPAGMRELELGDDPMDFDKRIRHALGQPTTIE